MANGMIKTDWDNPTYSPEVTIGGVDPREAARAEKAQGFTSTAAETFFPEIGSEQAAGFFQKKAEKERNRLQSLLSQIKEENRTGMREGRKITPLDFQFIGDQEDFNKLVEYYKKTEKLNDSQAAKKAREFRDRINADFKSSTLAGWNTSISKLGGKPIPVILHGDKPGTVHGIEMPGTSVASNAVVTNTPEGTQIDEGGDDLGFRKPEINALDGGLSLGANRIDVNRMENTSTRRPISLVDELPRRGTPRGY